MKFDFPVKYISISQPFKGSHKGLDLGWNSKYGGKNVPIYAPADGVIIEVKSNYNKTDTTGNSYGNYVKIDHGNGYITLSAHLKYNSIKLKKGDKVKRGQLLGIMGNTGYSKGNHDHFEVRLNGVKVDPIKYLYANSTNIIGDVTAKKYKLLYKKEEDTKQMEELKKEIEALNAKNAELNNQIKDLQSQLASEKKYSFKFIAPKDNKYNIYLKEKEVLIIK